MSTKSSSRTSTSTTSQDNRVGADNAAVAVGAGANIEIVNEFTPPVAEAFHRLIDLAAGAGQAAFEATQRNVETTTQALQTIATQSQKGAQTVYTDLFPYVVVAGVVILLLSRLGAKAKR